ncbi:hypothetical protein BD770DRAFT_403389 [Pilaira anomala]|nr:hypothetical protein BD770DRAFT_403389 [Pilaira anomala]
MGGIIITPPGYHLRFLCMLLAYIMKYKLTSILVLASGWVPSVYKGKKFLSFFITCWIYAKYVRVTKNIFHRKEINSI